MFHSTYRECREAFLEQAKKAGAIVESHFHPSLTGQAGEPLAIDVAFLGAPEAKTLLVMSSGTHGYEGFVGSALQLDCLARLTDAPSATSDVAILMIHGVNPWGWSHFSRTNENNVDLNRNFIDFSKSRLEHPLAKDVQALNALSGPEGPELDQLHAGLMALAERHGLSNVSDALQRGQYFQSDGVGYGGDDQQWSTTTVTGIWASWFTGRDRVCLIDWHTGLGAYGEPVFLCFDPPGSKAYALAGDWWGAEALAGADAAYEAGSRPQYSGLLATAAKEASGSAGTVVLSIVIEFGTFAPMEAAHCLWIDRWLQHAPADADPATVAVLQQRVRHFFNPDDDRWRKTALVRGRVIIDRALSGLRDGMPAHDAAADPAPLNADFDI